MGSLLTALFTRVMPNPASRLRKACKSGTIDDVSHQLTLQMGNYQPPELFMAAMDGNNCPVLEYLITNFRDDKPSPPWYTDYKVIMQATQRLEHFKLFWAADPSVSTAYLGHTGNALGLVVLGGNVPLLRFLLEAGANPNDAQLMHRPAANFAIHSACSEIVNLLVDYGASIKESNALAIALDAGRMDILKLLIEKGGMDINIIQKDATYSYEGDNNGDEPIISGTVLHLAIAKGQTDVVRVLLHDFKADTKIEDDKGRTALLVAQEHGYQEIVSLLEQEKSE
ncbi:hypothetical protein VHEMI03965 [[Torrubiella] hemipterigena]|uniref:Uncharacterized protein n=1 Tax=[Torrubiella] hemipterigena TaxID=1531966 RepID=A0A0A1SZZ1_9HYPO|nr:hypothetical protein VHEMI03965 [[Torrubiella] hemipterigena]